MHFIEIFGFVTVSSMMMFYALENRHFHFVLCFSVACLAAAVYAALISSWPFAVVETIWSAVAFKRWLQFKKPKPLLNGDSNEL